MPRFTIPHYEAETMGMAAVHEAAHAVVALGLGRQTWGAGICIDGKQRGWCTTTRCSRDKLFELVDDAAVSLAPGLLETDSEAAQRHAESDIDSVVSTWKAYGRRYILAAIIHAAVDRAAEVLRQNKTALHAIADALWEQRYLDSADLHRIFTSSGGVQPKFPKLDEDRFLNVLSFGRPSGGRRPVLRERASSPAGGSRTVAAPVSASIILKARR